MRPKIPDTLVNRIERVYETAGYATESEFIRDAIRRQLDEVEQMNKDSQKPQQTADRSYDFEYTLVTESNQLRDDRFPPLHVRPEGSRIANRADEGKKLVLSTQSKDVEASDIKNSLEQLAVIDYVALTQDDPWERKTEDDGWVVISLDDDQIGDTELDAAVDTILSTFEETLQTADGWSNPHKQLEDTLNRYTSDE